MTRNAQTELVLHGDRLWLSPYFFSAFVALREKRASFRVVEVALEIRAQKEPAYRALALTARVPCLVDGDFALVESAAIVEYVDEELDHAPWLLPRGRRARAQARQVMGWLRSDLGPLREERSTSTMFYEKAKTELSERASDAAAKLVDVAERLLAGDPPNLFGEWTIADAELAFMLMRLRASGDRVPERVARYVDAQWARPSVQAFVAHERPPYVPYR